MPRLSLACLSSHHEAEHSRVNLCSLSVSSLLIPLLLTLPALLLFLFSLLFFPSTLSTSSPTATYVLSLSSYLNMPSLFHDFPSLFFAFFHHLHSMCEEVITVLYLRSLLLDHRSCTKILLSSLPSHPPSLPSFSLITHRYHFQNTHISP